MSNHGRCRQRQLTIIHSIGTFAFMGLDRFALTRLYPAPQILYPAPQVLYPAPQVLVLYPAPKVGHVKVP